MSKAGQFAEILNRFINRSGYTLGQLAKLTGLPKTTIASWRKGRIAKPRDWRDLVQLATVLHLDEAETTELLQTAHHPSVERLLARVNNQQDRELLAPWMATLQRRLTQAPFQAIADLPYFTGRHQELETLKQTLLNGHPITLYSFQGMGGVGKTVLAAHIAYRLRSHFPDGVLWARVDTLDTMSILSIFAQAYGCDVQKYKSLQSRSCIVRELLAHKRALIVLDNVQSSQQVKPLLPPSGTCTVIITTRRHDLSISRGAHRFEIGPFDKKKNEAHELFVKVLGQKTVQRENVVLVQIAEALGHLPLALDIAASRMAYEPGWSPAEFWARLSRQSEFLSELTYEDQSVRLSFDVSYEALPPRQQSFFNALGVFRSKCTDVKAAAYVGETSCEEAENYLRALYGLSLIQQERPGRYRLHPLLSAYAREKMSNDDAYRRMVEFFVRYVEIHQDEYEMLDKEIENISIALETAFEKNMHTLLVQGANAWSHYLEIRGLYAQIEQHLSRAERITESNGDIMNQLTALYYLGRCFMKRGDYDRAETQFQKGLALALTLEHEERISTFSQALGLVSYWRGDYELTEKYFQQSLTLANELGDKKRVSAVLQNLGALAGTLGDYAQEETYYHNSLAIAQEIGDRERISLLLQSIGVLTADRQDHEKAEVYYRQSLAIAREIGDQERICKVLLYLGAATGELGKYVCAEDYLQQGLALARELNLSTAVLQALGHLGCLARDSGKYDQAKTYFQQGLVLARKTKTTIAVLNILNSWGELCIKQQDWDRASQFFQEALELARKTQVQEHIASALYGIAQIMAIQGNNLKARCLGEESLTTFEMISHPRANEVSDWLTCVSQDNSTVDETCLASLADEQGVILPKYSRISENANREHSGGRAETRTRDLTDVNRETIHKNSDLTANPLQ